MTLDIAESLAIVTVYIRSYSGGCDADSEAIYLRDGAYIGGV